MVGACVMTVIKRIGLFIEYFIFINDRSILKHDRECKIRYLQCTILHQDHFERVPVFDIDPSGICDDVVIHVIAVFFIHGCNEGRLIGDL